MYKHILIPFTFLFIALLVKSFDLSSYHTLREIKSEINTLASSCPHLSVQNENNLLTLRFKFSRSNPSFRFMVIFGEHSRELITVETALTLSRYLCDSSNSITSRFMGQSIEILIIPVVNEDGRRIVERGYYCKRTNANGVDINRNWDAFWQRTTPNTDVYSGTRPFTEKETIGVRNIFTSFRPNLYGAIHSGSLGCYTSYAYSNRDPGPSANRMQSHLLNACRSFNCYTGPMGKQMGYLCPGSSLDYVFTHNVPLAFAMEIYHNNQPEFRFRQKYTGSCFSHHSTLDSPNLDQVSSLLQLDEVSSNNTGFLEPVNDESRQCLNIYNPSTTSEYQRVTTRFSQSLLVLFRDVAFNHSELKTQPVTHKSISKDQKSLARRH